MLRKKTNGVARRPQGASILRDTAHKSVDRRTFLKGSGVAAGGLAAISAMGGSVTQAKAQAGAGAVKNVKTVCTHCSVGCTVVAEVSNGVWVGQEPGWDSPFNLGAHCAKGAAVREHAHGERRLKYPMKKEGGEWKKISWEQAINEIGDQMMQIREESGPDSVYTGLVQPSTTTNRLTCSGSSPLTGGRITSTTRRGFVTPPRWPVLRTHGATAP